MLRGELRPTKGGNGELRPTKGQMRPTKGQNATHKGVKCGIKGYYDAITRYMKGRDLGGAYSESGVKSEKKGCEIRKRLLIPKRTFSDLTGNFTDLTIFSDFKPLLG